MKTATPELLEYLLNLGYQHEDQFPLSGVQPRVVDLFTFTLLDGSVQTQKVKGPTFTGNAARQFSGGSDLVNWGNSSLFNQRGDLSIGMWIKLPSNARGWLMDYGYYDASSDVGYINSILYPYAVFIAGSSNSWKIGIGWNGPFGNANDTSLIFDTNLANDVWYYIGISRDDTAKTVTMYVGQASTLGSGVVKNYTTSPPAGGGYTTSSLNKFCVGNSVGAFKPTNGLFNNSTQPAIATIDDYYLWSRALDHTAHLGAMLGFPSGTGLVVGRGDAANTPEVDVSSNGFAGNVTSTKLVPGHVSGGSAPENFTISIQGQVSLSVKYSDGTGLTQVSGSPSGGQYNLITDAGQLIYTFSASDGAREIDITYNGGTVLRFNDRYDRLLFKGNIYELAAIERSSISESVGLEVTELVIEMNVSPIDENGDANVLMMIEQGAFDGALLRLERIVMPKDRDTSLGSVVLFSGAVSTADIDRVTAVIHVKSLLEQLNTPCPKNLYSPGCRHVLFDAGCTLNLADFTTQGVVSSATTKTIKTNLTQFGSLPPPGAPGTGTSTPASGVNLNARTYYIVETYTGPLGESIASAESTKDVPANQLLTVASPGAFAGATGYNVYVGLSPGDEQLQNGAPLSIGTGFTEQPDGISGIGVFPPNVPTSGYFTQGSITFTSGPAAGVTRHVDQYFDDGSVVVVPLLDNAPNPGDTFTIVAGCDRSMSTCRGKFDNLIHFGGEPFVPDPAAAI